MNSSSLENRSLRNALMKLHSFLDHDTENARVRKRFSESELRTLFRRALRCERILQTIQQTNPDLNRHLSRTFGEEKYELAKTASKTLFICLLDNLRLSEETVRTSSRIFKEVTQQDASLITDQNLTVLRPLLRSCFFFDRTHRTKVKASLLVSGVISDKPILDRVFTDSKCFQIVLESLLMSKESRIPLSVLHCFDTPPILDREVTNVASFLETEIRLAAQVIDQIEGNRFSGFIVGIAERLDLNGLRNKAASLLAKLLENVRTNPSVLLNCIEDRLDLDFQNAILTILRQKGF